MMEEQKLRNYQVSFKMIKKIMLIKMYKDIKIYQSFNFRRIKTKKFINNRIIKINFFLTIYKAIKAIKIHFDKRIYIIKLTNLKFNNSNNQINNNNIIISNNKIKVK